jgi:hypothetical protein
MVTLLAASTQSCEDRASALWASLILWGMNCILESRQANITRRASRRPMGRRIGVTGELSRFRQSKLEKLSAPSEQELSHSRLFGQDNRAVESIRGLDLSLAVATDERVLPSRAADLRT